MITASVKRLSFTAHLPLKGSVESACFDLYCDSVSFEPDGPVVQTGLAIALPPGYALMIYPRSGLASKLGLNLRNTVGVVDSDYRGEIIIKFTRGYAHAQKEIMETLTSHGRVAQAMIIPIPQVSWHEVTELPESARGTGGFGSTGTAHHPV